MPRLAESLTAWRKLVGKEAGRTAVACDVNERQPLAPGIEAIPWREVGDLAGEIIGLR